MKRLWVWQEDKTSRRLLDDAAEKGQFGLEIETSIAMGRRLRAFYASLPGDRPWPDPLPADFPVPRLRMPHSGLAPDFFRWGPWRFVSARLRAAMALPDWAVDYRPAVIEAGSRQAHQQDYALMYVHTSAVAVDLETSDLGWKPIISHKTGNPVLSVGGIYQIRFRPGMSVPADLFEDANANVLLSTDALAERVMAAGCTGVWFVHPLWLVAQPYRFHAIRTAEGIAKVTWTAKRKLREMLPIAEDIADAGPDIP